jgi:hypothetical protein
MSHLRVLINKSARRRQTLATANAVPNARQWPNAKRMLGVLRRATTCQALLNSSPASSVQGQRPQKLVLIPAVTRGLTHKATATHGSEQAQAAASYFSQRCKCRGGGLRALRLVVHKTHLSRSHPPSALHRVPSHLVRMQRQSASAFSCTCIPSSDAGCLLPVKVLARARDVQRCTLRLKGREGRGYNVCEVKLL